MTDPVADNNASSVEVAPEQQQSTPDLSITQTANPDPAQAGSSLTYTVQVNNAGPDSVTDVEVTDTLPAAVTFASAEGTGWLCGEDAGVVTCDAEAALPSGDAAPITIIVNVPAGTTGSLVNTVNVTSPTDTNTANNSSQVTTQVEELAYTPWVCSGQPIVAQGSPSAFYWVDTTTTPYGFDDIFTLDGYAVNAIAYDEETDLVWATVYDENGTHLGIATIDGAGEVSDPLLPTGFPAGNYNVGAIADGVYYVTNGFVTTIYAIDLETFAVSEISIDSAGGAGTGDFVLAPDGWFYAGTNSGTGLIRINPADGTVEPVTVPGLPTGTYGAAWLNASGDLFLYDNAGTVHQIDLNLDTPDDPVLIGSSPAQVSGSNDATACTAYTPFADLSVTKTAEPDPAQAGSSLTYTLDVFNAGRDSAADVEVTDALPDAVTFVRAEGGDDWTCTYDGDLHEVSCEAEAAVPLGTATPITVTVNVPAGTTGDLVNTVNVTTTTDDPDLTNNEDTINTPLEELDYTPFVCDGRAVLLLITDPNLFYRVDTSTDPFSFDDMFSYDEGFLNGIAYDNNTNLVWAAEHTGGQDSFVGIVSIDAAGEVSDPVMPTGLPDQNYSSGTIVDGVYYITRGDLTEIYAIDLSTLAVETITIDSSLATGDIVFGPDGWLYAGVNSDTGLVRVDLNATTPTVENVTVDGLAPGAYGSIWANASGDLFLYDNTSDTVTQVDLNIGTGNDPVVRNIVAAFDVSGGTDATNCTAYEPYADLEITKEPEADTAQAGSSFDYTINVFNNGADSAEGVVVTDALPDNALFVSADGGADWSCTYDETTHEVSCEATDVVGLGPATPITVTVNVPTSAAGGNLVNNVDVTTTTDDPNEENNEDTTTTTVEELDYTPFVCTGDGYIIQNPTDTAAWDAQLYRVNTGVFPYTFEEIGDATPYMINAMGYHPSQNVLYGWAWERTAGQPDVAIGMVRIDATGEVTELGIPTGVPDVAPFHVGTVSNDGSTYYLRGGGAPANEIYAIDLTATPMTAETITLDASIGVADFVESPTEPGVLYGTAGSAVTRITLDLDNNTGTVESFPVTPSASVGAGGVWMTADGDLIAYNNGGTVYQIDLDDPQNPTIIATVEDAPSSGSNDGAACAAREPSADLSMDKTADQETVGVGESLTYTLQVFNEGPDGAENVVVTDTLPAGIASVDNVNGNGWACTTTGLTEIECSWPGTLGLGDALPIEITVTMGTAGTELVNSATVTSDTEDPDEEDNEDEEDTDVSSPSISVDKVAEQISALQEGDTIEYFYHVENTGNVELTDIDLMDDVIGPIDCPLTTLPPDGSMTCIGEYTVTLEDFNRGEIVNVATVTGDPPGDDPPVEDTDDERVPNEQVPGIDVDKYAEAVDELEVGDTITYYYEVTNTGNVTLTDITAEDNLIDDVDCPVTVLDPGESTTCTAEYTVTQDDVDNGAVINIATVTGDPPGDEDPPTDEDEEEIPNEQRPRISVDKTATNATELEVGNTIDYEYVVTNTGNVTLTNISVNDNLIADVTCPVTELAPTESTTCTGSYTVTQEDFDRGEIVNIATATGEDPDGNTIEDDDNERVPNEQVADIEVDKNAEQVGDFEVGDVIDFEFVISNVGNVTLTDITVDDPLIVAIECPATELAPGDDMTCTGSYEVDQEDVDRGEVTNHVTVTGDPPGDDDPPVEDEDEVTVENDQESGINVDKVAEQVTDINEGDVIEYFFYVTNTGDVTLTNVTVDDPLIPDDVVCPDTELSPEETMVCTGEYTVTLADDNRGEIINTATVTGDPPGDGDPPTDEDEERVPNEQTPDIRVNKIAEQVNDLFEGQVIDYQFVVTNTGNVTLTNVSVDDVLIPNVSCPTTVLDPGDAMTCSASYTVTAADEAEGEVVNHATASGEDPDGDTIEDDDEEIVTDDGGGDTTPPDETDNPGITVDKIAEQVDDVVEGDVIDYQFIVTNTGDVMLTNVTVEDPLIPDAVVCPDTVLDPNESMTCTGSYTVTAANEAAGEVVNYASVTGEDPDGNTTEDGDEETVTDDDGDADEPDEESDITVEKVAEQQETVSAGDVIEYSFIVTNTGDVTLTNVTVDDPLIPNVSCPDTTLDPDETMVCTASYTVSEEEASDGMVVNTATVTAEDPDGNPIEDDDQLTIPGDPEASLFVNKTSEHDGTLDEGDVISYEIEVVNDGTVTVTNVDVSDPLLPNLDCPDDQELAPGESIVCTGEYTVTAEDVEAGQVVNIASATADGPDGLDDPSESDTEIIVDDSDGDDGSGDDGGAGKGDDDDDKPTYPQLPPDTGLTTHITNAADTVVDATSDVAEATGSNLGYIAGILTLMLALSLIVVGYRVNARQRGRRL